MELRGYMSGLAHVTFPKGITSTQPLNLRNLDSSIETILEYIQKNIDLVTEHPGCKVTILEIPVYSIVRWNKHSGHKNPEKFTE